MSSLHNAAVAVVLGCLVAPLSAQMSSAARAQGGGTSLQTPPLYAMDGLVQGDRLGASIATLPDLDGDGLADLLVGAPNRQPLDYGTKGHVFVLSGADGFILREHEGWNNGDRLGHAVALLPDLDGDGVPDYGAGAVWAENVANPHGPPSPGVAAAWSGATGAPLLTMVGAGKWECFGAALGALGDVDGDGVGDLLVTARFGGAPDGDATVAPGHVRFISGATGDILAQVVGDGPGDQLGWTSIALPDLNGDGLRDVAAAAWAWPSNQAIGQVLVLSGADGSTLGHFEGSAPGESFGYALAELPDLDGDGKPELAIGAPGDIALKGHVAIVSPATGETLFEMDGTVTGDRYGMALAAVGDRDGDGVTELAVGAPWWNSRTGRVLVVSPVTGKSLWNLQGHAAGDHFGEALQAVPDLTGDGLDELAVGAPLAPAGAAFGRVSVTSLP